MSGRVGDIDRPMVRDRVRREHLLEVSDSCVVRCACGWEQPAASFTHAAKIAARHQDRLTVLLLREAGISERAHQLKRVRKGVTRAKRARVIAAAGGLCYWCRETVSDVTIEHITPIALGGTNDETNLTIAHQRCNVRAANTAQRVGWKGDLARTFTRALS